MALTKTLYPDNEKLLLGTDGDLEIFSNNSTSIIDSTNQNLDLQSSGVINIKPGDASGIIAWNGAQVELYHNANKRLNTTADGVQLRGGSTKEHWCEGHLFPWTNSTYDIGGTAASDSSVYYWRDGLFSRNLILRGDSGEFRVEAANGVDAFTVDSDNGNTIIGGSGTLTIPDTIVHAGDTNTKIRFPAADTVSVEAGGLEKLRIEGDYAGTVDVKGSPAHLRLNSSRDTSDWDTADPIGKLDYYVGLDTTNNLPYNAGFIHCLNETNNANEPSGALVFGTSTANASGGAVERFRITKDGHVGIGSTSPHDSSWGNATDTKFLHIKGTNYGVLSLEGTSGTNTKWSMGAGDGRFYMAYNENDSTHVLDAVRSTRDVEAMAGNFVLRAANKGIDFTGGSSVGTAANIMDDYEEGTWTPNLVGTSGTDSWSDTIAGSYTKIGNQVTARLDYAFDKSEMEAAISLIS